MQNESQSQVITIKLRVSPDLKSKIEASAKAHNRSMNQDMVARLQESFSEDAAIDRDEVAALIKQVSELMRRIDSKQ